MATALSSIRPASWRRVAPFALFMVLLALRGALPAQSTLFDARWLYAVAVASVGALLLAWRREYGELDRQNAPTATETLAAAAAGVVVFGVWITLDGPSLRIGEPTARFVPLDEDGRVEWPLVAVRAVGAALVVPVMEELFWRSFLMRWLQGTPFERVDPRGVTAKAILLSTFVFVLAHTQWLAAAIAGVVYALLYIRTGKLWTAVIAHAVTNAALAAWVIATARWEYW